MLARISEHRRWYLLEIFTPPEREAWTDLRLVVASYVNDPRRPDFKYRHASFTRAPTIRRTNIWRAPYRRPVCFHCGILGHVYRYCHRHLQELDLRRSSSRYVRRDNEGTRSDDYVYPRRNVPARRHASRSPSPCSRRYPTPPFHSSATAPPPQLPEGKLQR